MTRQACHPVLPICMSGLPWPKPSEASLSLLSYLHKNKCRGGYLDAEREHSRPQPPPFFAILRVLTAGGFGRIRRQGLGSAVKTACPDDLGAAGQHGADQNPERGDQRVRFR